MKKRSKKTNFFDKIGKDSARWSFSKAERFGEMKKSNYFYNLPSTYSKRSCSFGYGKRQELKSKKGLETPAPCAYEIPSCFDRSNSFFTMGTPVKGSQPPDKPGPGTYDLNPILGSSGLKYSFGSRRKIARRNSTPSAYEYNPVYNLSEKQISVSISEVGRGDLQDRNPTPGPGSYNVPRIYD